MFTLGIMFRNLSLLGILVLAACTRPNEPESADNSVVSIPPPATSVAAAPASSASTVGTAEQGSSASTSSSAQATEEKPQPLEPLAATEAARAKGFKPDFLVPNPVNCPVVPPPKGDPKLLQAQGNLAGLMVDIEGFLRADMGVAEVVALLGPPVLCNDKTAAGYRDLHLAPRDPSVRQVMVETHDGDLIGLLVEFEKRVKVDVIALEKRYGQPKRVPGPLDSFEAGSDVFFVKNDAFNASFEFARRDHADPAFARKVHRILFRRTPAIEILPEGFRSPDDVARLVALALRPRPAEAVGFAGTLGIYSKPVNRRVSFGTAPPIRNVTSAAVVLQNDPVRQFVQAVEVTFKAPISGDVQAFARALGTRMGVPTPAVSDEGNRKRIDIVNGSEKRGRVLVEWTAKGLQSIEIVRADAH